MHNILTEKRAVPMDTVVCVREIFPKLSALGKFGGFKPESERAVRTTIVEPNPALERITRAWAECEVLHSSFGFDKSIDGILKKLEGFVCSAKDIEAFTIALGEFQSEKRFGTKAGIFLSTLINNSQENRFVIHISHIAEPIDDIGYLNKKNITVEGNAGGGIGHKMRRGTITVNGDIDHLAGFGMRGGTIRVNGNSGHYTGIAMQNGIIIVQGNAGEELGSAMGGGSIIVEGNVGQSVGKMMKGGTITVRGNAGFGVGSEMKGGTITVEGDAGHKVGDGMTGGEIHINGSIASIVENLVHGKIFHKEELIFDK